MHGRDVAVRASSITISGMSGHAGRDELLRWYRSGEWHPEQIFVTHGEPRPASALAADLRREGAPRVTVPALGDDHDVRSSVS
jgi:metallo-beta-lactamase family protein